MHETVVSSRESKESKDDIGSSNVETGIAENENNSKCSKRKKQLTPFELSEIIVEKGIKSRTELLAFANMPKMKLRLLWNSTNSIRNENCSR